MTTRVDGPSLARRRARSAVVAAIVVGASWWVAIGPLRATAAPTRSDAVERQQVLEQIDTVGRRGFLFEVRPPGTADRDRLFLYGTIHLGRVGSEPFNPPVVAALRASCRLALEADPTDASVVRRLTMELGRYDDGDTLEHHLSPALMARVTTYGLQNGLAIQQLARFKPWLLANMVTLRDFGQAGLDPALGSELYLSGYARARGMPIVEIEGLESQLRLLAGLPEAMQTAQLDEALSDVATSQSPGRQGEDDAALFDLWLRGDATAASELLAQLHAEAAERPFGREFVETVIDARNRAMADRAAREMQRPGPTFFAVGALHLFGPTGLVAELRQRGYRVVDLQAPAATPVMAAGGPDRGVACPAQ